VAEIRVGDGELEQELATAFAQLADNAAEARLVLPGSVTPNHRLADLLRHAVERAPALRRVVLSHPSPGIRFVASSLSLLVPTVTFHAITPRDPSDEGPVPDDPDDGGGSTVVGEIGSQDPERAITSIFARAGRRHARQMVLTLDSEHAVDRRLVNLLSDALETLLSLELLVLVHPSPALGFLATGLGLRCPRLRVVVCQSPAEARDVIQQRMT
jgi:hypothetical protein